MSKELKENIKKAEAYLQRFKDNVTGHFINGEPYAGNSGKTFENTTPVDNSVIGQIA
ncbi:MAG TPA: 5-carboxymethyl-2-hydroxymuconate semialdehyde dehydrogenase, partial [Dehalococcoidia bacterium]|nr:5-carboxymethyl-2-hydroxymuconate semialdehyde dehydrogenase [Dehalococcoidia bacterium]